MFVTLDQIEQANYKELKEAGLIPTRKVRNLEIYLEYERQKATDPNFRSIETEYDLGDKHKIARETVHSILCQMRKALKNSLEKQPC